MDLGRFAAYLALACWIAVTAITVTTANEWSAQTNKMELLKIESDEHFSQVLDANPTSLEELKQLRSESKKSVSTTEKSVDAVLLGNLIRKRFWWEFASWMSLTIVTCALWSRLSVSRSQN
jgi:hypothetical protein